MRLVMIDNYDSFTFNLVQLFYEFDLEVAVYRHDQITLAGIESLNPDWICISPGPKDPAHAGISKLVVKHFAHRIPILGVCLGMQVINEVFGGKTRKAPVPMHGKRCQVHHAGQGILANIPSPFWAARYHSLAIEPHVPRNPKGAAQKRPSSQELLLTARAADGVIMAIQHRVWPLCGVQFHPESFMTEFGMELVINFLSLKEGFRFRMAAKHSSEDRFPRFGRPSQPMPSGAVRQPGSMP
ncbi:anthranilate synthase component II [Desulfoferrobacter suflitae]|uniref:anthranilate synthase component II n=1 Tax=Desulfoferrobacter suflitae TaxID=2865782 RepID=UPI0021641A22|nr:aminodeoxychorismate/anthranilate synthase component II [Desulfoferrobacter suflitae]MCK8603401.1 aminodeoxychorismate/anthranilate synthase component II [Desulfoferrobacter suflitae]